MSKLSVGSTVAAGTNYILFLDPGTYDVVGTIFGTRHPNLTAIGRVTVLSQ